MYQSFILFIFEQYCAGVQLVYVPVDGERDAGEQVLLIVSEAQMGRPRLGVRAPCGCSLP